MEKMVIIGSGPAGLTAGIYAARADLSPLLLAGTLPGGLLTQTSEVENFPGFRQGINGYDLMIEMQQQAERFGTRIEYEVVAGAALTDGCVQTLTLESGEKIETKTLIIATGALPRWLGLPNEERLKTHGVSACATCDGAFFKNVPVVVIGGGDSAMEEANFLTRFASEVIVIHRRDQLRASKIMAERALNNPKIRFVWDSKVVDVLGETEVDGVIVENIKTGKQSEIACKGYFAALGHDPNTGLFRGQIDVDSHGFILLKDGKSCTNLAGVFAAGDCADNAYRQAITAAGMGCRAAMDAERYLEMMKQ